MRAVLDHFSDIGVVLKVWKGRLEVTGLSDLPEEQADRARGWIRTNKGRIIKTLDRSPTHPARVSPAMVAGWRTARKWITARLPELTAAGWTRRELFQAGQLRFPHGTWGVAWLTAWTRPKVTVKQGPRGEILFSVTEANGQVITQPAKPSTPR